MEATLRINSRGLFIYYCHSCNNQLNHINYGGYDHCQLKNFDCKKCGYACSGLVKGGHETGYYQKTTTGICKRCKKHNSY